MHAGSVIGMPLVSVVMPAYDAAATLPALMDSVLGQTHLRSGALIAAKRPLGNFRFKRIRGHPLSGRGN